jgi:hypothetical protein
MSEKEIEDLKAEVRALKDQLNPPSRQSNWQPRDYTENASMPASALRDLVNAVPDAVMSGLRADSRKPNPVNPSSPPQPTTQVQRGSGWAKPIPVEPPPGIELMDRMMDQQDHLDRVELARKIAQARIAKGEK